MNRKTVQYKAEVSVNGYGCGKTHAANGRVDCGPCPEIDKELPNSLYWSLDVNVARSLDGRQFIDAPFLGVLFM